MSHLIVSHFLRSSFLNYTYSQDLLGGLVIKTPYSQHRRPWFDLWSGNWIPHATTKSLHVTTKILCASAKTQCSKKKKKKYTYSNLTVLTDHSIGS